MDIQMGFIVVIIINIRSCLSTYVPLMFNQIQCDYLTHIVDDDTSYYIYWFGEVYPYLCTIQFSTTRKHQICYASKTFSIPHSLKDVTLEVRNDVYLKKFGSSDSEIEKTCVSKSNKLNFSLVLNYPPMAPYRPREYIKLKVYLSEKDDDDDDKDNSGIGLVLLVIAFAIVFGACIVGCCKKAGHLEYCSSRMNCQSNRCSCCLKMADCCIYIGTKWKSRLQNSNVVNDENRDTQFASINSISRTNSTPPPAYNDVVPEGTVSFSSGIQPPSYQDVTERRY